MGKRFYMPTSVLIGSGCVESASDRLAAISDSYLVVTGRRSAKSTGALDDAAAALERAGASWRLFDRVPENPTAECVFEGARQIEDCGAKAVLAIGGGSPMDAAKAMALLAANPQIDEESLFSGPYPGGCLPIVCVPTTAGTGSEVTRSAILTNDAEKTKSAITTELIFPRLALVDGRYLRTLGARTAVNTVVDALSHAAEGIASAGAGPVTDALAVDALGRIGACLDAVGRGSLSDDQRDSLMAAASEAGMVIANTGTTAVHALGYSLTYFRHIPHGRANGLVLPAWFRWAEKRVPERVEKAVRALGMGSVEELDYVLAHLLGERERLSSEEAADFAARASEAGNMANCPVRPSAQDLESVLRDAFGLP